MFLMNSNGIISCKWHLLSAMLEQQQQNTFWDIFRPYSEWKRGVRNFCSAYLLAKP